MNLEEILNRRINLPEIKSVVTWASENPQNRSRLWTLAQSQETRISLNALWIMTHLIPSEMEWLASLRDDMIDMLLQEKDTGKKRLLLKLLREQDYEAVDIRTDFLDFCLSKINSECEPYAIRCFALYAAFKMCRHFPELLNELEQHLQLMSYQQLSPGLKSALRQTNPKIKKLKIEQSRH